MKVLRKIVRWLVSYSQLSESENVDYYRRKGITIGDNVHIYNSFLDSKYGPMITIGDNVTITNASILAHDASIKKYLGLSKIGCVSLGDNVFIGYGSIILPGTTIGDDVIIGAGSVVRGRIPNDSIVFGNPAQTVGKTSEYISKYRDKLSDNNIYDSSDYLSLMKAAEELVDHYGFEK